MGCNYLVRISILIVVLINSIISSFAHGLFRSEINEMLPPSVRYDRELHMIDAVNYPPYLIDNTSDNNNLSGVSVELVQAISEVLGIDIRYNRASSMFVLLNEVKVGRQDFAVGPIGDFIERQKYFDFIDYVEDFFSFVVHKGNPRKLQIIEQTCGLKIAVLAAGTAEQILRKQSNLCSQENKDIITIERYIDLASAIPALLNGEVDAFFNSQALLTYYANQYPQQIELLELDASFTDKKFYQGIVVVKNSPLTPALLAAMKELFNNGRYAEIMRKWGLEKNMIKEPGLNLTR